MPLAATWSLAFICNYRCPYCFIPWNESKIGVQHAQVTAENWLEFWERMYDAHGSFWIHVAGGEPFVYPGIVDLLARVSEHHSLSVSTNLSWKPDILYGRLPPGKVAFGLSFHPHFVDFERFLSSAVDLQKHGYTVTVAVVAYPPLFSRLESYRLEFEVRDLAYNFLPYQGKIGEKNYPQDYTKDERDFLYLNTVQDRSTRDQQMRSKPTLGRLCAAGQMRFRADADGVIYRCAPSVKLGVGRMGHIQDPDFKLLEEPSPCPAEYCTCPEEYSYLLDLGLNKALVVGRRVRDSNSR